MRQWRDQCSLTPQGRTQSVPIQGSTPKYWSQKHVNKTNRPLGILFPGEINNAYVLLPVFRRAASITSNRE